MEALWQTVMEALRARYEQRAAARGDLLGGSTILGGKTLAECSPSMQRSFREDADAVIAALHEAGYLKEGLLRADH